MAAKLTSNELEALVRHFDGIPLATAGFWRQLSAEFYWEIYAIDPRFWDSMKVGCVAMILRMMKLMIRFRESQVMKHACVQRPMARRWSSFRYNLTSNGLR